MRCTLLLLFSSLSNAFQTTGLIIGKNGMNLQANLAHARIDVLGTGDTKKVMTRSYFLKTLPAIIPVIMVPKYTKAAVPSIAEYSIGSGAILKKDEIFQAPVFTKPIDKASTIKALDETQTMLSTFQVLAEACR